jgi:formate-nitrite transporter family protein
VQKDRNANGSSELEDHELDSIEEQAPIRAVAIFEAIRREGRVELDRPVSALTASGFVAGIALGLSVLSEGLFRRHLPDAPWRPLIESLGYSVGFVVVILSQMQLFTENTIKAVCPVLNEFCGRMILRLLRLWGLVLGTNLAGAVTFGIVLYLTRGYQPEVWAAVHGIAQEALAFGGGETLLRGIGAGWLIAALVWMMPNAADAKTFVIVLMTYLVSLAGFAHVIAGTVEATIVVLAGDRSTLSAIGGYILPALAGNLLGGTVFFTVLAWVQIRTEFLGKEAAAEWTGQSRALPPPGKSGRGRPHRPRSE